MSRWACISYTVLPEAVPFLLLPCLHRKNAARSRRIWTCWRREWELYHEQGAIAGRRLNFVYFGGGTPSFLSVRQLGGLVKRLKATSSWNHAEEITFECEPGTLTESKLTAIRKMGVTRLSLGVEHFDDHILEVNGRGPSVRRRSSARTRMRSRWTSRRST